MRAWKPISILFFLPFVFSTWLNAKDVPGSGQKGPYEVGHTNFLICDAERPPAPGGRPIAVYVWYPVDPQDVDSSTPEAIYPEDPFFNWIPPDTSSDWESYGLDGAYQEPAPSSDSPFPLVMVSPGWGGPAMNFIYLGTRLASHGFVVAILTHYGDGILPWYPLDHIAVASLNRPRDVSFVLTELLLRNEAPGDLLYNLVRPDQIAASGHSLGGYATLTLAGGDDEVCDSFLSQNPPEETCIASPPDPRIKVIVPLDGSNQILRFYELARITTPTLGIGQEWETAESWQARQHAAISGQPCYRVDLNNSVHMTFSNICEAARLLGDKGILPPEVVQLWLQLYCTNTIPSSDAHRLVTKYMIAFLKTHLVGETGYQQILTPGWAITREQDIEFFVTERINANATDEDWPCCYMYFPNQPGSEQERAEKDPIEMLPIEHLGYGR